MTITNAGDTLIDRINESGGSIYESIDQRMDAITDRISTSGEAFASLLDTRIAKLTQSTDDVDPLAGGHAQRAHHRHGLAARRRHAAV